MLVFDVETLEVRAVNDAAVEQYGYDRQEFLQRTLRDLRPPLARAALWRTQAELRAGRDVHWVAQHCRRDGSLFDVEVSTSALPGLDGRLHLARIIDITEQKRGADAARFLDRASGILMSSLEHDFLCRNLAALCVPALGDWCVVYRDAGDSQLQVGGYAHAGPLAQTLVGELLQRRGPLPNDHPAKRAFRDGAIARYTGEAAVELFDGVGQGRDLEISRLLDPRAALYVPIRGRATFGVLECVMSGPRREHDAATEALAVAIAERAALAMDNAERYHAVRVAAIAAAAPAPAAIPPDQDADGARWVVENIPDCYFHVDADWTLTYANAAAERLVGRRREEIVGHNLWALFPDAIGTTFQLEYQRALDEQQPVMFEEYYPGLEAWLEINARPTRNGLAIFFRDVTRYRRALDRLEESEVTYRDFLESATDLVHMLAPDGRVVFANRAWRETLGFTEDEVRTLNVLDVVAPESREVALQGIADCLRGEEVPERELVVIAKDGRRVVVRGRSNCRFVNGQPVSTRAIFRDVTAEVEARELLAQSRRSEAASARAKTAFLDRMSHEMRTPLTAVIGFANILVANRGGRLSPQEVEFARRIAAQGQNLLTIVEDVLAYAEIESRRVDLAIAPVELRALVEEVCVAYDEIASRKGVALERSLPASPATIETDVATLRRVLRYTVNDAVTRGGIERVIVAVEMDRAAGRPEAITVRATCGAQRGGAEHAAQANDPIAALELGISIAQSLAQVLGYELAFERDGHSTLGTLRLRGAAGVVSRRGDDSASTLHALIDASPLPVIAFDPDLTVRLWNEAAEELFGWTAAEAVEQRLRLLRPEDEPAFRDLMRTALDSPHGVSDVPAMHVHRDGHAINVRVALAPLRAPDGRLRGFFSIITDVTARTRLEEELRQAQKMEVVGRLAGGIAHDFNNLLTVIGAHAQFLIADLDGDDERTEDARAILDASDRAAALTRQLLVFSRKELPQRGFVDLNRTLANTEKMLRRTLGSHIEFASVPAPAPVVVHADPVQLEQVLMNLVLNARDAMPRGGALVVEVAARDEGAEAVRRAEVPKAGRYALVIVSDSGVGMDEATRRRVFEPFFTTKGEGRGTGLGLATVHNIVTACGGSVGVESTVGVGTTFRVWLPVASDAEQAATGDEQNAELRGSETVLVVEDQDAVRNVAARVLRAYGYTVLVARHGNDALSVVQESGPEIALMLTDLVMPEITGAELAARVHALAPHIGVLFMSGYSEVYPGMPDIDQEAPLVRKPFTSEGLARSVREAIDRMASE